MSFMLVLLLWRDDHTGETYPTGGKRRVDVLLAARRDSMAYITPVLYVPQDYNEKHASQANIV